MFSVLLTVILFTCHGRIETGSKTLQMVNLVYRHGARSPLHFYPNDKYQEKDWPDGAGRLTQKGMKQEYDLGIFLKERYVVNKSFINRQYLHKEIYIRSSGVDRCLQSAETQLAGLYPPEGYQIWNPKIHWQPIPVQTVPRRKDFLLRAFHIKCPNLQKIWKRMKGGAEYHDKISHSTDLLRRISNYTGMEVDENNVWKIVDTMKCEKAEGLLIPKWADGMWNEMYDLSHWLLKYRFYGGNELGRLLGGALLNQITMNMGLVSDKNTKKEYYKMNIFSGHDTTVLAISTALDIRIETPTFAACVMIELYHSTDTGYVVEMLYRNNYSVMSRLNLRGCNFSCPLERFIELTRNRVTTDWYQDCDISHVVSSINKWKILSVVLITITMCCVLFLIIVFSMKKYASRSKEDVKGNNEEMSLAQDQ